MVLSPFTALMRGRSATAKIGFVPNAKFIRLVSADQKELLGASLVMKALMYFGGFSVYAANDKLPEAPDYPGMSRVVHAALKLDPYNMDGYYFAQAFLVWDAGQVKVANDLLEYGMKYRTWDWYLPFFAGFNYAFFLKDYANAAKCYKAAADLSSQDLHISLAGRYIQESGQTQLAIKYLKTIIESTTNETFKKSLETRLEAFEEVDRIEVARDRYRAENGKLPGSVEELLGAGYLKTRPVDPYGGRFYLEPDGKVATTSKFAFGARK
ncbi:hypothetical protein KI809_09595 [Geobacter pelophilus]|uniref:Tetratricopeptide repeat protein n=2 Tax=Geoanaerobacter pelophilus TaxID=60036 RepID=A0AAW4L8C4_9BACT|nr:hypothetical protein [Geoanaerobacter pelophilus]MBT0664551.1 hypothetical protein [Geoanaerobacter pelophilus]